MTSKDTSTYLTSGGYLQKGPQMNVLEKNIKKEVLDLLPGRWFRDEKIFQLERRAIFSRLWHVASFTSRFKQTGDYLSLEMFGWSFFIIKDKHGKINAFHNVCRHRGHPVTTKASGSTTVLACKFHGWTYLPDGSLHKAREYMNLPGFDPKEHSLFPVHTHVTSQGFIFINFDAADTPVVSFEEQFGDDFDPNPTSQTGKVIGDEFELFPNDGWEYDHTWESAQAGIAFNWKTFADGFQECYHCQTGHPTTLPKDFCLKDYYLRQGIGASRHYLPPSGPELAESYITWLYPIGAIIFSHNLLFIARFNAKGALDTSYQSETYRRAKVQKNSPEYDEWMKHDIKYWRFVEVEDVELALDAQKGFKNGILGRGRLHPVQEHAVKWYQDKVRKSLSEHAELEKKLEKNVDYSIPAQQAEHDESDPICKMMGPEMDW